MQAAPASLYNRRMTFKPDVTVAAVVERAGRFLIVQERAARRVVLNQPAGHLEDGESLQQAVIREALEETGYPFVPEAITGLYLCGPGTHPGGGIAGASGYNAARQILHDLGA